MPMYYLSEAAIRDVVAQEQVSDAIETMYGTVARGEARNFPTVREGLQYANAVFGFKSGIPAEICLI